MLLRPINVVDACLRLRVTRADIEFSSQLQAITFRNIADAVRRTALPAPTL